MTPAEPAPGVPAEHLAAIAVLGSRYGWRDAGVPEPVAQSVSNTNYRVMTASGAHFIRVHRAHMTLERIEREQAAMRWAGERGVPVAPAIADGTGQRVHRIGGAFWTVSPWVGGRSLLRGTMTADEAALLGAIAGRLHAVLREWPAGDLHKNSELGWDTERSIAELSRIDDLIRYYPAPPEDQLQAQRWLRAQLARLESGVARPSADFAAIPVQPTHGDPHERNLMVDANGDAVAVVDWERFCLNPPAFEVLRTLTFAHLLDEPHLGAFLRGYSTENRLDPATVGPCTEQWWQSQLHNTWAYRERFIRGSRATEQFFADGAAAIERFSDEGFRAGLAARLVREAGPGED